MLPLRLGTSRIPVGYLRSLPKRKESKWETRKLIKVAAKVDKAADPMTVPVRAVKAIQVKTTPVNESRAKAIRASPVRANQIRAIPVRESLDRVIQEIRDKATQTKICKKTL